ncbi:peptidoglycan DD-metalloendopeptidase family protein [Streptomyces sp. NPDC056519]|uniref:peptidoglycan DD-metalloendopeptidase family protein n=1 Tax=Streptomyces sp. NPDC056519 TaxID=3345849 RepID=UPI0036CA7C71
MALHNRHRKPSTGVVQHKAASVAVTAGIGLAVPLTLPATASAADKSAWDVIAECESNGRWNLPSGHASSTGGLQIQQPTWEDYGGREFAPRPHQATKEQQIAVAERILAGQGPRAWTCNAKTGNPLDALVGKTGGGKAEASTKASTKGTTEATGRAGKSSPSVPAQDARSGQRADGGSSAPTYRVRSGDTLQEIARSNDAGTWQGLYEANQSVIGADPDLIHAGQVLRLPARAGAAAGAAQDAGDKGRKAPAPAQGRAPDGSGDRPASTGASRVSPVAGFQGKNYGGRSEGYTLKYHTGSDYAAPHGTEVRAAAAGKVIAADPGPAYGINVRIQHPDGTYTLYAHLSAKSVQVGQNVEAGRQIGYVGSTGNSTGPHLHFEVRNQPDYRAGAFIDPSAWLARR